LRNNLVTADSIPVQVNASDLSDEFIATVLSIKEKDERGAQLTNKSNRPVLHLQLKVVKGNWTREGKTESAEGKEFIVSYSKPKALTGNSQLDVLFYKLDKLGLPKDTDALLNKTFKWQRADLPGSMKGNARHYPVEIVTVEASASA